MDASDWEVERQALLRQARDLQAELDAVTPLRRHLLATARAGLQALDRAVERRLARPVVATPPELLPGESASHYDARALAALRAQAPQSPALARYRRARVALQDRVGRSATRLLRR